MAFLNSDRRAECVLKLSIPVGKNLINGYGAGRERRQRYKRVRAVLTGIANSNYCIACRQGVIRVVPGTTSTSSKASIFQSVGRWRKDSEGNMHHNDFFEACHVQLFGCISSKM
ncbi:hypothetical protein V6N13_115343 [Hibiscus sabdariffa]